MARLEELTPGTELRGLIADRAVRVVQVEWNGTTALTLTYTTSDGRPGQELLYRDDEPRLEIVTEGQAWSFDADGELFRLVSEAKRISLAHLFDPMMPLWSAEGIAPDPNERAATCSRRSYPVGSVRIVLVDDRRAGFLDVRQRSGRLLVKWLLIEPAFQRQGIGADLVRLVQRAARQRRWGVSLEVLKSNTGARRLYERLGFRAAFETKHSMWMRSEDAGDGGDR